MADKKLKKNSPFKSPETGLAPMQELFVAEYLKDMNASRAAKDAGYSEETAGQLGYQLLQIPSIRAAVQLKMKDRFERLDMTGERILLEMFRLATVDLSQAFNDEGKLLDIVAMPEDVRRAIIGFEAEQENVGTRNEPEYVTVRKIKLADKNKALEMMGKYFKLLTDRVEIKDTSGIAAKLAAARKRKDK